MLYIECKNEMNEEIEKINKANEIVLNNTKDELTLRIFFNYYIESREIGINLLNNISISIKSRCLLRHFEKWHFITHIPKYHFEIQKLKDCVDSIEKLYKERLNNVLNNRNEIINSVITSYENSFNNV